MDLIQQNIADPSSRHLMLLTENNAALSMLFDHGILKHQETTVIFGSDFPLDRTDLQVCLMLQRVKHGMAQGTGLMLVHCEALYESMYDLLSQHYTSAGGQLWVRLAFGTHSRLCPINPNFRVIVIVDKEEAYTRLAAPLLNRPSRNRYLRGRTCSPKACRLRCPTSSSPSLLPLQRVGEARRRRSATERTRSAAGTTGCYARYAR